ncbi:hypothetical protein FM996_11835 [Methylosinus sporium]|uniref:Uncharacterized protein n=1 Tax=Methylosinus sporium TaxID=428 RepID=A0A549ST13_METSR|nr:hypothetical protein [Methylosinus sporium]TRL32759.1 hypothetical protein FM996_11835 [Methylosinus sporium]
MALDFQLEAVNANLSPKGAVLVRGVEFGQPRESDGVGNDHWAIGGDGRSEKPQGKPRRGRAIASDDYGPAGDRRSASTARECPAPRNRLCRPSDVAIGDMSIVEMDPLHVIAPDQPAESAVEMRGIEFDSSNSRGGGVDQIA